MTRKNITSAILILFISVTSFTAMAQSQKEMVTPFRKGSMTINLGLGFGTQYHNDYAGNNAFGTKAALEIGLWSAGPGTISLGPQAGFTFSNKGRDYEDDFNSRTFVIACRSAWHYGWKVSGLDTYAGLSAGAGFQRYKFYNGNKYINENDAFPVVGGFVGVSYFFTPNFGVNAEAGFDITALQGGLVFKLK